MPSWEKWTLVAILAVVLWFFPVSAYLNLGHKRGGDFVLNGAGWAWCGVLVVLVFFLIFCMWRISQERDG